MDEGRRLGLYGELPADRGAVVVRALERMRALVPVMPGEEGQAFDGARRADALVSVCEGGVPGEGQVVEATPTVVVHATMDALQSGVGAAEIEDGPVVDITSARRLACHAKVQVVLEDDAGEPAPTRTGKA